MDELSDSSDVDIDEVAKMVEDLEDLDKNLFRDALQKKKNSFNNVAQKMQQQSTRETQKKVAFQDIDDYNPLDDLLSDSINESRPNTRPLSNTQGSKIADLFGTKTTESTGIINNTTAEYTESTAVYSVPSRSTIPQPAEKVENDFNAPPKVTETSKQSDRSKKSSLMEDLFGSSSRATSLKNIYDTPVSKSLGITEESVSASMPNLLKSDHASRPTSTVGSGFTLSSSTIKEPRRGRPKSTVVDDPLGLLATPSKTSQESSKKIEDNLQLLNSTIRSPGPADDLPEWLGGTKKFNQQTDKRGSIPTTKTDEETHHDEAAAITMTTDQRNVLQRDSFAFPDVSRLAGTQFEQQSAIVTMQQQEHELRTATILSQQTDQLNYIVESQKNKLDEQEKLFDTLVKGQVNRQAMLETQIKLQQARIDNYIQALMKQPMTLPSALRSEGKDLENTETKNTKIEAECLLHTLEVEKQNLEHLVDILKEKHKQEIKILEDSHNMQMRFTQEAMDKLESKLRREIEELEKDYEKKIEKLFNEKEQQEKYFKEQIENLKANQVQLIKENHSRHSEQISLMQSEHAETIENISRAKELERNAVDFIKSHKTDLDNMLERSQFIFDGFQTVSEEIKNRNTEIIDKRGKYLKEQEETLRASIEQLNTQQKALDNERKQLVMTAQKLESETSQLTIQLQKHSELFYEREERLGMQEKTLIRERELLQEQNKWEREHLQCLKEAWIADQKQQIKLLANEREAVAAERAKLEVLSSLKSNSDDITKAELEAALKAAHNAANEVNRERQRWQERADSLQADQRKIKLKEKQLMEKAKELEDFTQSALIKREEGLRALKDAQRMEKQHKDQVGQLHLQLEALAERENRIVTEKIALARERLALRVSQIEKPEKDVTNDSLRNKINESIYDNSSQLQTHFRDVVDPQLLLLKLNLDNRLDTSTQLLSDLQTID